MSFAIDHIDPFQNISFYRFTYQAVVRPGAGTRDERDKEPIIILDAESPPILVHPSHLGGALSAGQVFNIGVRLKTKQVCEHFNSTVFEMRFLTLNSRRRVLFQRLETLKYLRFNPMPSHRSYRVLREVRGFSYHRF